jgi:hypothetical protein
VQMHRQPVADLHPCLGEHRIHFQRFRRIT